MNYLDFTDTINQEIERNFKKKTNEIIKICNQTLTKLKKERKQIIKKLEEINIDIRQIPTYDNNLVNRFNELQIVDVLNDIEIKIFNVKMDKERYEFINHNYEEIKYIFYRHDNNDTIENNITKI